MSQKKIKIILNSKEYVAILSESNLVSDPRDKRYECNIENLGTCTIIESKPFVGSSESQNDFDFVLDINIDNKRLYFSNPFP